MKSPCARGREEVLYGWASDSDGHRLPDGVAYSVGPGTGILDVVLQVNQLPLNVPPPATPLPLPHSWVAFSQHAADNSRHDDRSATPPAAPRTTDRASR